MKEIEWLRRDADIGVNYLRLSGVEEDELSPDIQLKLNLKHFRALGLESDARIEGDEILGADVYGDIQKGLHSAFKRDKMPQWLEVLARARDDARVAAVGAYDLARVFRNVEAMIEETRLLNSFGVHLILNGKVVNLQDPHEWSSWMDQAKQAEWESRITTWRLKGHYQEMRDLGIYFSHIAPFGLERSGKRHKVQWQPNEKFFILVRGLTLLAEGLTCAQVAIALRAEGHTWHDHRGRAAPTEMTIRNWIISLDRYKSFLDPALVYRVESEWARRVNHQANSKRVKHPLPFLRQLVYCEACGRRYYCHWRASNAGTDVSFYEHPSDVVCAYIGKRLSAKYLHAQFWEKFGWLEDFTAEDIEDIAARLVVETNAPSGLDARLAREKLELELLNLRRNYNRGDFGDPETKATRKFFLGEQLRLEEDLKRVEKTAPAEAVTLTGEIVREILTDLTALFVAQAQSDWQRMNMLLRTVLQRVMVRDRALVRLEYKPEWEGLGLDA